MKMMMFLVLLIALLAVLDNRGHQALLMHPQSTRFQQVADSVYRQEQL